MIRDLKTMIQNWVNPWIRDGQILRSSRSRSSRSSRSGHDQIQIIRSRPRIPRIDTPNGSILDPLLTPLADHVTTCQGLSQMVQLWWESGHMAPWPFTPDSISPHGVEPCSDLSKVVQKGVPNLTPIGWISTPLGGFRPPGEK